MVVLSKTRDSGLVNNDSLSSKQSSSSPSMRFRKVNKEHSNADLNQIMIDQKQPQISQTILEESRLRYSTLNAHNKADKGKLVRRKSLQRFAHIKAIVNSRNDKLRNQNQT